MIKLFFLLILVSCSTIDATKLDSYLMLCHQENNSTACNNAGAVWSSRQDYGWAMSYYLKACHMGNLGACDNADILKNKLEKGVIHGN